MSIVLPEQSFTPFEVRGIATEISKAGVRLKTPLISPAKTKEINEYTCCAKIHLEFPDSDRSMWIKAQLFWARYYEETHEERAYCELGFSFINLSKAERDFLEELLTWLPEE